MNEFLTKLEIRALTAEELAGRGATKQLYVLLTDLVYQSDKYGILTAPAGMETDFASIPRLAWAVLDPEDPVILYPSVIHDAGYGAAGAIRNGTPLTRPEVDDVLREAMQACGANGLQRGAVWAAVRAAGWQFWRGPSSSTLARHAAALAAFPALGVYAPRSPEWPRVRSAWLKDHPTCAACGGRAKIEVHHKHPFHLYPALELDPDNFITLCECSPINHHLRVGHLGNWKDFNPNVEADAAHLLSGLQKLSS